MGGSGCTDTIPPAKVFSRLPVAWNSIALAMCLLPLLDSFCWVNYSDLTRPHPTWWFMWGTAPLSHKLRHFCSSRDSPLCGLRGAMSQIHTAFEGTLDQVEATRINDT